MANKIYPLFIALWRIGTGLAFGLLIVNVLLQVISRTFLPESPVWTEELTRFSLLFLAAFGLGLSFRNGELVNVDLVCDLLPLKIRRLVALLAAALTVGFCALIFMPTHQFVSIGSLQTSPAIGVHMNFIYFSVMIMVVGLAIFALLRVVGILTGRSNGTPEDSSKDLP